MNNCPSTFSSPVQVLPLPVVGFTPSATEGCAPFTVTFSNTSFGPTSYAWDFGDGETSNLTSPIHIFETPGTYQVMLIGTDNFGCSADSTIFNIIVHGLPTSNFNLNDVAFCSGVDSIFTDNLSAGGIQYEWAWSNGSESTLFEPGFLLADTGLFTLTLIVENQFACRDTSSRTVNLLGTPAAVIPTGDFDGCAPHSVHFDNGSRYADNFIWDFGDGNTSTDSLPSHQFATDGSFLVQLIAANLNGCPPDTALTTVTVFPVPIAKFQVDAPLLCGLPYDVNITNQTTGAFDYAWDFDNGQVSDDFEPSLSYTVPADYTIQLVAANQFNCQDTFELTVSANLQPESAIGSLLYQGCEPDTIQFMDESTDATSWHWDFGDGNTSTEANPIHVFEEDGEYSVQLVTSYNDVCFDSLEVLGHVLVLPSPVADFTWTDLTDGLVSFTNASIDAISYDWDFGDGTHSSEFSPTYEYNENGIWSVVLTATHANGCESKKQVAVAPGIFYGLYFPNAMSPESGIGDVKVFKPTGIGIKSYYVKVFSPWGQLVWFSDKLDGEQPGEVWDGRFKGEVVPQGAYAYLYEVTFINSVTRMNKGTVLVIR
ncbi:MAG: PKD domain-containing protein [Saprospiraceae bacterium]|nr:PKD domain-containing protein [Saprospiraceae bacterium]